MGRRHVLGVRGSIPQIVRNDNGLYEGDLKHYFRTVFYHAENLLNPYHNFRHLGHILWLCHQACIFYVGALSKMQMRKLLIAGLFHDYDHTGTFGPDSVNIERSIIGLRKHLAPEDEASFGGIARLIDVTEYPYTIPWGQVDLSGRILRDADLSQAFTPAWIQQVIFGLAQEWGKSPFEVLKMQESFYRKLEFKTEWARQMFPWEQIKAKIAEVQELVALLTD